MNFSKGVNFLLLSIMFFGCSSGDNTPGIPVEPGMDQEDPVAVSDHLTTSENQTLLIQDLLDNDTVYEYARITAINTETEKGGSVEDNGDDTYTYTPSQDYIGEDTFEYTICDNASTPNCSSATVTVEITAAELHVHDDFYETQEDRELVIRNALSNDGLVEGAAISSVNTKDTEGTVVLESNGDLTFTLATGFDGEDVFIYTVCNADGSTCHAATVTVTVIDEGSPVAIDDQIVIYASSTGTTTDNLLENDELVDDAELTAIYNSGSQGTVLLNEDGTVSYDPSGFVGEDFFSYTLCDDDSPQTCVTAQVTVTVIEPVSFNIPSDLTDYYEDLVFSDNGDLNYQVLSEITAEQHTTTLSYGQRHEYLYDADEDLANPDNVILIYSGESRYWREYTSGNNSYSPQTFNTEHIYPQSHLTSSKSVTDLHHLRVADASVNSQRSNHPYTEGSGGYELINGSEWYPGDKWKGDMARMVLYLNVRYGETFEKVGNLELFLKWNAEDPVSEFERQRQSVISGAQGNRNPFIDNPYLATLIWGGEAAENFWE